MTTMSRFLFALFAGLVAGAAVAKLPPPTPEEQAKTAQKAEAKKAQTEHEKKAIAEAQDRIVHRYRAGSPPPASAQSDQLKDSDVPSGAKAPDVPHPGTGG